MDSNLHQKLKQLSSKNNVTLFITLLTAFNILLHRYTLEEKIIIGFPESGRNDLKIENLIGLFLNTLLSSVEIDVSMSFEQLLDRVKRSVFKAYESAELPFEKLVEEIQPERSLNYNPLFQILFNMLDKESKVLQLESLNIEYLSLENQQVNSKFDLTIYVKRFAEKLEFRWVYNRDLYQAETIESIAQHYQTILEGIVAPSEAKITDLPRPQLPVNLPDPHESITIPEYQLVTDKIKQWAEKTPNHTAIVYGNNDYSYKQLWQKANVLAHQLKDLGVEQEIVVGISGEKSFGFIVAIVAVLLTGGIILTIDNALPLSRRQLMLEQAKAKLLLSVGGEVPPENEISITKIFIDPENVISENDIDLENTETKLPSLGDKNPAYIFFTSGTTGIPKGVLGTHQGLAHFIDWQQKTFSVQPDDRVSQLTGLSFDVLLREIFLPLSSGASLCIPDSNIEITQILSWLESEKITIVHTVPSIVRSWLLDTPANINLNNLRCLFFAGEPLTGDLVNHWRNKFPQAGQIVNLYGATETTLAKFYYIVPEQVEGGVVPVGYPLPQTQGLVMTENESLCCVRESGEIVIRTPFRSLGYINDRQQTEQKFTTNPYSNIEGDFLYHTGDKGRYRHDGCLEILGRIDEQVKIRGIRIEPLEISEILNQHPQIKESIVMARENSFGEKYLVAYVVTIEDIQIKSEQLREYLETKLPTYMIPRSFVSLERLPLTPNGKIDKKALPNPDLENQKEDEYIAPSNETEIKLTNIWQQVLGIEKIGINDNFFSLGGHSLLATQVISRIRSQLKIELSLRHIFQYSNIKKMSDHIISLSNVLNMNQVIDSQIDVFVKKSKTLNGKIIQERESWNTEITKQAIRHFAYGISDDNPLWLDSNYASKTKYGKLIAPPTFLISVLYPFLHGYPMEVPMSSLIGSLEFEWFEPIVLDDKLTPCAKQTGVQETRDRQNRRLVSILAETTYTNQNQQLVGKANSNLVWIGRTETDFLLERQIYQYSEEELNDITHALEQENKRGNQILWGEDIEIGTKLPPLVRGPLTIGDLICWQSAIGPSYRAGSLGYKDGLKAPHTLAKNPLTGWQVKYSQQHEDFLLAKQRGMPAPFDNGAMRFAWLSTLLINWMGDEASLKRLSVQMLTPILYGDTVWYQGIVKKKTEVDQGILVQVKVTGRNQLGELTTTGEAEVLFSSVKNRSNLSSTDIKSTELFIPTSLPEEACVHQLIEAKIKQKPQDIAIIDSEKQLTYQQLNQSANQLAHYLQQRGVKSNTLVGIYLERSSDYVIAILAILKAGAGYLPLDPNYPSERLAFMLQDTQVSTIITCSQLKLQLPNLNLKLVDLDLHKSEIIEQNTENLTIPLSSNNLAYGIYTSGSTGQPKAVCIPHYSLSSYLRSLASSLGVKNRDRYLHTGSFSFSAAVRQTLFPLTIGATLIIANDRQRQSPDLLFELIKEKKLTIWDTVPTVWRFHLDYLLNLDDESKTNLLNNDLRLIMVTGEPLSWKIPYQWRYQLQHQAEIINLYSQSETTGTVCYYLVPEEFDEQIGFVPLGVPLPDTEVYLLNQDFQFVKEGEVGEICVTGKRQIKSYLYRPQLTKEKFINNPFDGVSHLYKTGDTARYRSDGNLECVGRIGNRVKIRGFRIELSEIEKVLGQYPNIKQTIVMARENSVGEQYLVAYVVTIENIEIKAEQLREYLERKLPTYMIPRSFVSLERLPLTPNGKIDKKALPNPDLDSQRENEYIAPSSETEIKLTNIWQEVLDIEKIGIDDNFFSLGGHSLLATQVLSRIRNQFKIELPIRSLFESPTISQLAIALRRAKDTIEIDKQESNINLIEIPVISRKENLPLSFTQERLWFINQLEGNSSLYNISRVMNIEGELDIEAIQKAICHLIERHESLRSNFINQEGKPYLQINLENTGYLEIIDLRGASNPNSNLSSSNGESNPDSDRISSGGVSNPNSDRIPTPILGGVLTPEMEDIIEEKRNKVLDLENDRLVQFTLIQTSDSENILVILIHHIISDGWSMGILEKELSILYQEYRANQTPSLKPLPIQYADYSAWQREYLQTHKLESQLHYWTQKLQAIPPLLELPTDNPRPLQQTYQGKKIPVHLDQQLINQLQKLSQDQETTLFMTVLTAFSILLSRYSNQDDLVIGTPIANRHYSEDVEQVIGFFANTLPLRVNLDDDLSFAELLLQVKQTTIEASENQDLPFEKLVEEINPVRSLSYNPVFQVMLAWNNTNFTRQQNNLITRSQRLQTPSNQILVNAKFDLSLAFSQTKENIRAVLNYNSDLFSEARMNRMVEHLLVLLKSIVNNPQQKISKLDILTQAEKKQILIDWNQTAVDYNLEQCIHQLFEEQALQNPDNIAVIFEEQKLTYQQLNEKANQLAHYLITQGIKVESKIGIYLERSVEMIIAILAVLKAGGAYVPLDPNYPRSRINYILEDANIDILITQKKLNTNFNLDIFIINLDEEKTIKNESKTNPVNQVNNDNLAYVIYTSGSTGKPKGVLIEHQSLCNLSLTKQKYFNIESKTRVLQFFSLSFDGSVWSIFPTLIGGGTLVIANNEQQINTDELGKLIVDKKIEIIQIPPSVLSHLSELNTIDLKRIIVGGEACPLKLAQKWSQSYQFFNAYGPTESTVCATISSIKSDDNGVNIGKPIDNTQTYILDTNLQPVPISVTGELYIGGVGVARGYLDRPDLTAEKFIDNPFGEGKIYKTGDLCRYLPNGNIEYIGRIDNQVKIRGFRIELGEIESVLQQYRDIKETIVIAKEKNNGDKYLVAYLIANNIVSPQKLRDYLKGKLPNYMIPSGFIFLEQFPITPNGKVDQKALPDIDYQENREQEYVLPTNETQRQLVDIWQEVLDVEKIGVNDNFFSLGGNSLLATQVVAKIRTNLLVDLPLRDLLEYPTIGELADRLSQFTIMETGEI